jgi:hypothetical protein
MFDIAKNTIPKSNQSSYIEKIINEFLKKFYQIFNAKLLDKPLKIISDVEHDVFQEKIKKYFKYEDQIKQFELLIMDEESKFCHFDIFNQVIYITTHCH